MILFNVERNNLIIVLFFVLEIVCLINELYEIWYKRGIVMFVVKIIYLNRDLIEGEFIEIY